MPFDMIALYVYAYVIGAIPTAYIIGRLVRNIDIRQYGSGNVGGANLSNHVSRFWLFPMGLFEVFGKGCSPIWLGTLVLGLDHSSHALVSAGLLVLVGNNWSIFLRFTGGRGIAVTTGLLFALAPIELAMAITLTTLGWLIFRSSGIWVLISLTFIPLWTLLLNEPLAITWFSISVLGLICLKRLVSNWTPFTAGIPAVKVLINRLLLDRDTSKRDEWVFKKPIHQERE